MSAEVPPYVRRADADEIEVACVDPATARRLSALGFGAQAGDDSVWVLTAADAADKARVLGALRDAGLPFGRGREWSPAEVFEELRDQGLVQGRFCEIVWSRPGVFHVRAGR